MDEVVDLKGGSLAPGLTSYGSPLGLVEIRLEPSTNDVTVLDPLVDGNLPSILGKDAAIIRAVDGLQFQGRNTLLVVHFFRYLGYSDHSAWCIQTGLSQWSDHCHYSSER